MKIFGCLSMKNRIKSEFESLNMRFDHINNLLLSYNPRNVLKRGYSLTRSENQIVKNIAQIEVGDEIKTILQDGELHSRVTTII